MQGTEKMIEKLNDLLADKLTVISQDMVHSEMCANWGYERLYKADETWKSDDRKYAEKLIGRIFFLKEFLRAYL